MHFLSEGKSNIHLRNSLIGNNAAEGVRIERYLSKMVIDRCNISYNNKDGVYGERIDGQLLLTDSSFHGNRQFGMKSNDMYGQVVVDGCSFQDNSMDGFNVRLYDHYDVRNIIHSVIATNTSFSNNEHKGMDVSGSCSIIEHYLTLSNCYVNGNINGGLEVYDPCNYMTVSISDSTFIGNRRKALNLMSCRLNNLTGNIFENNIDGTAIISWLPSYFYGGVTIKNNYFSKNSANVVLRVSVHRSSLNSNILIIHENLFKNNTCRNVLNIQFKPQDINPTGITIKDNTFKDNIPTSLNRYIWTPLPAAVVSYDKPSITFTANFMDNPLFPFQLNVQGDHFGTTSNAVMNWWGTVCEAEIEERIIDQRDRYNYPLVQYFPYLNSANISDLVTTNRSMIPFIRGHVIGGHVNSVIYLENVSVPYLVDRDIFIKKHATLYIQPGTSLHFTPFSRIYVQGKLVARGTSTDKIILEPQKYPLSFYKNTSTLVRLVYENDTNSYYGVLEMFVDQDWQRVCYQSWNKANTDVICRQLGFRDSLSYTSVISADRNVSIWSMTLSCTGHETDFRSCEQTHELEVDCSANVYIECKQTQWAGLLFPADAYKSTLEHMVIRDAGSEISPRYYDWSIRTNEAVMFHMAYHTVENIEIEGSYKGLSIYPDPINQSLPFKFISIRDCSKAMELYQSGFTLQSVNVSNCNSVVYFDESWYQNDNNVQKRQEQVLRFLSDWPSANQCINHVNLTTNDVFIVTPNPSDRGTHCSVSITSKLATSRIGLSVLYSNFTNPVSVIEVGEKIMNFTTTSAFTLEKAADKVVSNSSSIRIDYQRDHSSRTFYVHVRIFQSGK